MYVRWRKRDLTRTTRLGGRFGIGGCALSAVLVECHRVAGAPRQRFVAHLATVRVWDAPAGKQTWPKNGYLEIPIPRSVDLFQRWKAAGTPLEIRAYRSGKPVIYDRTCEKKPRRK